ncbi:MAG: VPLPA-CTERM sorting domain-containing protein [Pseudomonadota bacterium]
MNRFALALVGAGMALGAGSAQATVFNDPLTFATFQFTAGFNIAAGPPPSDGAPLDPDDLLIFNVTGANSMAGTQEFAGTDAFSPDLDPFQLVLAPGGLNNGELFTIGYDRSVLTPGEIAGPNGPGSETGTLSFTIANTAVASASSAGPGIIEYEFRGLVNIADSGGFYNPVTGSFVIEGSIGSAATNATASFTVSVPSAIAPVPVPASALLLLSAIGGAGLVARRRARACI